MIATGGGRGDRQRTKELRMLLIVPKLSRATLVTVKLEVSCCDQPSQACAFSSPFPAILSDISPVGGGQRLQSLNVTNFANWPEWLKVLVLVPHGILAYVTCWVWWPKSEKGWRKLGFVAAYLVVFYFGHALRLSDEGFQIIDANAQDRQ